MNRSTKTLVMALAASLAFAVSVKAGWEEGVAAFRAQNYAQAVTEFRTVVEEQPEWPGGHLMLGRSLLQLGRSQEALTHLRKAYDLGPDDVAVQMVLGKAYVKAGRYRDASELLGQVNVASLPKAQQGALHQYRAIAFDKTGQPDQAAREMSRAVQLNPGDAGLQYQYGTMLFNRGDTANAVQSLEKAASLESGDAKKQKAYADALVRLAREQRGSAKDAAYRKAVSTATRLVGIDSNYDNLMLLGGAQLGAGQYTESVSTFERAAGKNSRDWLTQFYIGQARTAASQYPQAERALQVSLNLTEDTDNRNRIWKQLGFVYEKQKNYSQAVTAYQKAGDNTGVTRARENQQTQDFNKGVEAEQAEINRIKAEEEALEQKLRELEGDTPPLR